MQGHMLLLTHAYARECVHTYKKVVLDAWLGLALMEDLCYSPSAAQVGSVSRVFLGYQHPEEPESHPLLGHWYILACFLLVLTSHIS